MKTLLMAVALLTLGCSDQASDPKATPWAVNDRTEVIKSDRTEVIESDRTEVIVPGTVPSLDSCGVQPTWSRDDWMTFGRGHVAFTANDGLIVMRESFIGRSLAFSSADGEVFQLTAGDGDLLWARNLGLMWQEQSLNIFERSPLDVTAAVLTAGRFSAAAISRDGERVAAIECLEDEAELIVYDADLEVLSTYPLDDARCARWEVTDLLAFAGQRIVYGTPAGSIEVLDTETDQKVSVVAHPGIIVGDADEVDVLARRLLDLKVSPDGRFVATTGADGTLKLHSLPDLELIKTHDVSPHRVRSSAYGPMIWVSPIAWSPEGAIAYWDGAKIVVDSGTRLGLDMPDRLVGGESEPSAPAQLAFSNDGRRLVAAAESGVTMWGCPSADPRRAVDVSLEGPLAGQARTRMVFVSTIQSNQTTAIRYLVDGVETYHQQETGQLLWWAPRAGTFEIAVEVDDGTGRGRDTLEVVVGAAPQ